MAFQVLKILTSLGSSTYQVPTPVGTKDAGERVGSSVARALWSPFLVVGGTHKRSRQAVEHFQNKLWLQLESRLYEKERGHRKETV